MKLLITGASGFIGRNLINKFQKSEHELFAVVRKGGSKAEELPCIEYDSNSAEKLIADIADIKPDGIIHLASHFTAAHRTEDINNLVLSNVLFGTHLLEAASKTDVKWFLNTGTFWQNYENADYSPVNLYAATKQAFQDIGAYYAETSGLIFTTIKLNDTFGRNDTRKKLFTLWKEAAATGDILSMSAGEQIMDISYIDDVTNAYAALIGSLASEQAAKLNQCEFVVTNREKPSLRELASIYELASGKKLNILWGNRPYRQREVMVPWEKGTPVPGWKQQYSLTEAIKKMYSGDDNG